MNISQLLAHGNYVALNRDLIKKLGLLNACMLSELMDEYLYYSKRNMINSDGWFFSKIENVEERIGLSRKQQDSAIKKLTELDLIEKKRMGVGGKRHFRLNDNKIWFLLSRDDVEPNYDDVLDGQTSLDEMDKQDCTKETNRIVPDGQSIKNLNKEPKETINNNKEKDIFQFVEYAYGRPITPIEFEKINHMVNENNEELVKYAIELGSGNGIRNLSYVDKVLTNWQDEGIKTLNQAQGYVDGFNQKKQKPKRQYKPKDTIADKKLKEWDEINEKQKQKKKLY